MKMKSISQGKPIENPPGVVRKTLAYNAEAMLCHFDLKKGSCIPLHSHRATQIGYVISGKVKFLAEKPGGEFHVETGDSYVLDGFKQHGAEALEDAELVEMFAPARDEYKDF